MPVLQTLAKAVDFGSNTQPVAGAGQNWWQYRHGGWFIRAVNPKLAALYQRGLLDRCGSARAPVRYFNGLCVETRRDPEMPGS